VGDGGEEISKELATLNVIDIGDLMEISISALLPQAFYGFDQVRRHAHSSDFSACSWALDNQRIGAKSLRVEADQVIAPP